MMRVNLLPHRQIRREARQREFSIMALFSGIAAAVIIFLGFTFINAKIDAQAERNARLEAAILNLDKKIADIKDLEGQISTMLERKQVVENLQINRGQAVVLLDELSRQMPEGMYLKSIKQQGSAIAIEGLADTSARVATLVRNLSASNYLEAPSLIEIKSVVVNTIKQNEFVLNVNLKANNVETNVKPAKGAKQS